MRPRGKETSPHPRSPSLVTVIKSQGLRILSTLTIPRASVWWVDTRLGLREGNVTKTRTATASAAGEGTIRRAGWSPVRANAKSVGAAMWNASNAPRKKRFTPAKTDASSAWWQPLVTGDGDLWELHMETNRVWLTFWDLKAMLRHKHFVGYRWPSCVAVLFLFCFPVDWILMRSNHVEISACHTGVRHQLTFTLVVYAVWWIIYPWIILIVLPNLHGLLG